MSTTLDQATDYLLRQPSLLLGGISLGALGGNLAGALGGALGGGEQVGILTCCHSLPCQKFFNFGLRKVTRLVAH